MNATERFIEEPAIPYSAETEQSVLGALLIDNDAIDRIGVLRPEHFFLADHQAIFRAISGLIAESRGADIITVYERLTAQKVPEAAGGLPYLNALYQRTPSSANIGRYADIVIDRAQKRGLMAMGRELLDMGQSHEGAARLLDRAQSGLQALVDTETRIEPRKASDGLALHFDALERRSSGLDRILSTGLIDLDKALGGGMRPGWLVVLAARPAMGKTALALNIAQSVSVEHSALFLSMEMPEAELHDRMLASIGTVALDKVMKAPEKDDEFWQKVTAASLKIKDLNLYFDDQAALRLLDVRSKARIVRRKHGLDLLVVDYLQLMEGDGDNRNAQIEGISRGLKALAKELGIVVVALAQLNREVEKRANRVPQLSDLRDSGAIEQDADAVIFLHREEVSNPNAGDQFHGFAQLRIAKFRHGRIGDVALRYAGEHVRFENHYGAWPTHTVNKQTRRGFE